MIMPQYPIDMKAQLLLEYMFTDDGIRTIAYRNGINPEISLSILYRQDVIDYICEHVAYDGKLTTQDLHGLYQKKTAERLKDRRNSRKNA